MWIPHASCGSCADSSEHNCVRSCIYGIAEEKGQKKKLPLTVGDGKVHPKNESSFVLGIIALKLENRSSALLKNIRVIKTGAAVAKAEILFVLIYFVFCHRL